MGKQPLWWGKIFNAFGFGGKSRVPGMIPIGRRHLRLRGTRIANALVDLHLDRRAGRPTAASDPNNWSITAVHTIPQTGDSLVFDAATPIAVQNDLPAGTQLGGIDINPGSGGCVTITGNSFALPDGGALTLESGAATISANIVMGGELCAVVNPGCA